MASMWRRAMLYLGLGPDDEYDDFDVTGEHQRAAARPPVRRPPAEAQHDPEPSGSVRTLPPTPGDELNGSEQALYATRRDVESKQAGLERLGHSNAAELAQRPDQQTGTYHERK